MLAVFSRISKIQDWPSDAKRPALVPRKDSRVSTATSPPPQTKNVHQSAALETRETEKTRQPSYAAAPGRRHFWLRRLHSLLGLVFGAYVTVHLLVNASGFWPRAYQENVDHIHSLEPMLPLIEILFIFIPLLFHALYGIYITRAGVKFNTTKYNYGGNIRYTMQRWAGIILLLFIGYHIATLHKWGLALFGIHGYPMFNAQNVAYQSTAHAIKTPYDSAALNGLVIAFYLLGVWSAVFHWANGLWTSAIAWGLTVTANAQRKWGHVCFGFGIIMFIIGTAAWAAFGIAGDPNLPPSATWTLPAEASRSINAQASGGAQTLNPHGVGEIPQQNQTQPKTP
jgi:succinate dehydrogenase / fumarate reductase cytochrome b subunit